MACLVNVIVPVFNAEKYLRKCLDSIFSQTYPNIFVYIVNDGSTDSSSLIIDDYKDRSNLKVIDKLNGGLSSARNAGLKMISTFDSSYIMFVDSDDYIDSDYVEKMVNIIQKENVDIVCSSFEGFDDARIIHVTDNFEGDKKYTNIEALERLFSGIIFAQAQTKLYKAWMWKDLYFDENLRFMEDQAIMFEIFYKSSRIFYYNYPGYHYYYSNNSLIRSKYNNIKVIHALRAYFRAVIYKYNEADVETLRRYAENCFSSAFLMLYPRFKRKEKDDKLNSEFKYYCNYVRSNKLIKKATFLRKNDKKKKLIYMLSPILYYFVYKIYEWKKN